MKNIVLKQYQEIVDRSAEQLAEISVPPEGWLRTVRKALRLSGAQLARRLNVSRAQVAQAERNELSGAVTLKTLQKLAEAMHCRVVYALVPEQSAECLLETRARQKAKQLVAATEVQMALESQALSKELTAYEIERLTAELLAAMPADLWDDLK